MKALTDEIVAKALGWSPCKEKPLRGYPKCKHWNRPGIANTCASLPKFTTKIDAIVAEIEARGLIWQVGQGTSEARADVSAPVAVSPSYFGAGKTASLALCHALLNFLKDSK